MAKQATAEKEVPKTDLVIATDIQPAVLFGEDHKSLEDLLKKIENEVSTIVPDVSSAKGRKAITANVSRITKSKTLLDKVGKEYNAAQKELLKAFDTRRKHAFTFLEDLQAEVRKPLTEWENKEKDRIAKCEGIVNAFIQAGNDSENWMNYTVEELTDLFTTVEEVKITGRLKEFEEEAAIARKEAILKIQNSISSRIKYDDEQRELKEMREKIAEQDRKNFEADQKAEATRNAQAAVIAANDATKLAEQREAEAKKQAAKDLEEAEEQRKIDIEKAAKAERDRIEAERQAEIEAEKKRAANKSHKGKINRAIVKAIVDDSKAYDSGENVLTEKQVKRIVTLIANNIVPNIKISY